MSLTGEDQVKVALAPAVSLTLGLSGLEARRMAAKAAAAAKKDGSPADTGSTGAEPAGPPSLGFRLGGE